MPKVGSDYPHPQKTHFLDYKMKETTSQINNDW